MGRGIGIEDDQPLVAVDDDHPRLPCPVEEPAQADHRRDLQRLGDDRRMAGPAPHLGGEAQDPLRVEPRRLARREVVRQQHGRRLQTGQDRSRAARPRAGEDPLLDVADVGGAGGQVRIGQAFEPGGMAVEHLADGMLGGQMLALDPQPGIAAQGRVGDHPRMRREDVGILRTEPLARLGLGLLRLAIGRFQAAVEPFELGGDRLGSDRAMREPLAARVDDQRRSDRDTGADGDPAEGLHR